MKLSERVENKIKLPFVILSNNTIIRPLMFEDRQIVSDAVQQSLGNLKMWLPWVEQAPKVDDYQAIVEALYEEERKEEAYHFAAFHNQNFMGMVSLYNLNLAEKSGDLGIWFRNEYPAVSFFFEGIKSFMRYSFENLKLRTLEMPIVMGNFISEKVAREIGFTLLKVDLNKHRQIKRYSLAYNEYNYDVDVKIVYKKTKT